MFMAEDYTGSKVCRPGDLVFNIMWAWLGALGVSETTGLESPSYGVYRAIQTGIFDNWYLEHLVRSKLYVAEYNRRSTGLHSSRLRLYPEMFFRMELGYPPLEEQVAIRNAVQDYSEGFDRMIASTDKQIQLLTEYKQTLIANAVTGKIRV
jgi:type I restriction enzyme S subunit